MDLWFIWLVQVFYIHTCCYVLYCAKDCLSVVSECLLILFIFSSCYCCPKLDLVRWTSFKYSFVCSTSLDVTTGNWEIVDSHMFNLMGMLFLVVNPTLGKKKNGHEIYFKETTSHLRSDWLIKNKTKVLSWPE